MKRIITIDVGGVPVPVDVPETGVPVRAIVVLATEHLDEDGNARVAFTYGASLMDTDHRVGMITPAYHRITDRARQAQTY